MSNLLKQLQENMATRLYGLTKEEALTQGICISCKKLALPKCYSEAGRKEYQISGLCEQCFDTLCGE